MYKLDFYDYLIEYYGMTNNDFQLLPNIDKSKIRKEYKEYLDSDYKE